MRHAFDVVVELFRGQRVDGRRDFGQHAIDVLFREEDLDMEFDLARSPAAHRSGISCGATPAADLSAGGYGKGIAGSGQPGVWLSGDTLVPRSALEMAEFGQPLVQPAQVPNRPPNNSAAGLA